MRYTASSDEFFIPNEIYGEEKLRSNYVDTILRTVDTYHRLIECGIRKEQARMVIPTSIFSHAYFTINLRNLFHLLDQRLDSHAQAEIRCIAEGMRRVTAVCFPIIMECYLKNKDSMMKTNEELKEIIDKWTRGQVQSYHSSLTGKIGGYCEASFWEILWECNSLRRKTELPFLKASDFEK